MIGWGSIFLFIFVLELFGFYISWKSFKSGNNVNTVYLNRILNPESRISNWRERNAEGRSNMREHQILRRSGCLFILPYIFYLLFRFCEFIVSNLANISRRLKKILIFYVLKKSVHCCELLLTVYELQSLSMLLTCCKFLTN